MKKLKVGDLLKLRGKKGFAAVHIALIVGIFLFTVYFFIATGPLSFLTACPYNRFLSIYCAGCGVTRAFMAILKLDIISALKYNAPAVVAIFLFIVYDIRALIALIRHEDKLLYLKEWHCYVFLGFMILFGIIRNIALIGFGIDFVGDFPQYTGLF